MQWPDKWKKTIVNKCSSQGPSIFFKYKTRQVKLQEFENNLLQKIRQSLKNRTFFFFEFQDRHCLLNQTKTYTVTTPGFIQASMSKIQGLFKDFLKPFQQFSRT